MAPYDWQHERVEFPGGMRYAAREGIAALGRTPGSIAGWWHDAHRWSTETANPADYGLWKAAGRASDVVLLACVALVVLCVMFAFGVI
jgi:hypothetical protein